MSSDNSKTLDKPSPAAKPKFKVGQTFLIGIGFMSCMFAWAMYNFYLPRVLAGYSVDDAVFRVGIFQGDASKLWTGVIMTLDNIAAILLQPYFGDLSDRLESKYGRRTPFLIIGIPVAALSMFIMPYAIQINLYFALLLAFIGLVIVFNLGMAMYRAPVVALMPDLTSSAHRSMANVIINVMGGVGSILGMYLPIIIGGQSSIISQIAVTGDFETQQFLALDKGIFWGAGIGILVILALYLLFVREKPTGTKFWHVGNKPIQYDADTLERIPVDDSHIVKERYSVVREVIQIMRASEKSAWYMFLSLFCWTMCADTFGTYTSLWWPEYVGLSDKILGSVNLITAGALLALGYPAALISNKKGRIWTMRFGSICFIIAFALLIPFQEFGRAGYGTVALIGIIACMVIQTFGGSLVAIAAITITWQLAPDNKVGTYTGLYYLFKQMGSIFSPILMGGILSLFTVMFKDLFSEWVAFIPYCLIFAILFFMTFRKVKKGEVGDTWSPDEAPTMGAILEAD